MPEILNLKEFITLIKKYESITIDEIKKQARKLRKEGYIFRHAYLPRTITGFGSFTTCTLCKSIKKIEIKETNIYLRYSGGCDHCVYEILNSYRCNEGPNSKTYNRIEDAGNSRQLLAAYKARARYMRQLLKTNNIVFDE